MPLRLRDHDRRGGHRVKYRSPAPPPPHRPSAAPPLSAAESQRLAGSRAAGAAAPREWRRIASKAPSRCLGPHHGAVHGAGCPRQDRGMKGESTRATATRMAGGTSGRARDERLPFAVRGVRACPAKSRLVPATPRSLRVCRAGGRDDGAVTATGCGGLLRSARGVGTMAGTGAGRRPALSSAGGRAPA